MSGVGFGRRRRPLVLDFHEESLLGDAAVPPVISVVFLQLAPNPAGQFVRFGPEWQQKSWARLLMNTFDSCLFQQSYVMMPQFHLPRVQNTVLFEYVVRDSVFKLGPSTQDGAGGLTVGWVDLELEVPPFFSVTLPIQP